MKISVSCAHLFPSNVVVRLRRTLPINNTFSHKVWPKINCTLAICSHNPRDAKLNSIGYSILWMIHNSFWLKLFQYIIRIVNKCKRNGISWWIWIWVWPITNENVLCVLWVETKVKKLEGLTIQVSAANICLPFSFTSYTLHTCNVNIWFACQSRFAGALNEFLRPLRISLERIVYRFNFTETEADLQKQTKSQLIFERKALHAVQVIST